MKILALSLLVSFSVTSIASPVCRYYYGPQKPELQLIYSVLNVHVEKKELSDDLLRTSVKNYIETMDPFKFIFTKDEVNEFRDMSEENFAKFKKELLGSNTRNFYTFLQKVSYEKLATFITVFNKTKEVRDEVERRIELYQENPTLLSDISKHPENYEQSTSQFLDYIASHALLHIKRSPEKLSTREALVKAIRSFREEVSVNSYLYERQNLPFLISKSVVDALDAHSALLMGPENRDMYNRLYKPEYSGFGIMTATSIKGIRIEEVLPGHGADKSGLKKGDIITHIKVTDEQKSQFAQPLMSKDQNWLPIRALGRTKVTDELLRGTPNSFAEIRVLRDGRPLEFKVERYTISNSETALHSNMYSTPAGNVAYIKLDNFYQKSSEHIYQLIENLKNQKAEGLVLDLRFNGGGSVNEFQKILGFFVKQGPAMVTKSSDSKTKVLPIITDKTNPEFPLWNKPLIVLVNKYSASASEALSGALKDYDRALIIGEDSSTYGKGSMQSVIPLTENATVKITGELFSSPGGGHRQFDGVKPDILIAGEKEQGFFYERDLENAIKPFSVRKKLQNSNPYIENKKQLVSDFKKVLKHFDKQRASQSQEKTEDETLAKSVFLMSEWMSQSKN